MLGYPKLLLIILNYLPYDIWGLFIYLFCNDSTFGYYRLFHPRLL